MIPLRPHRLIAAALLAGMALAGCRQPADQPTAATPAATPEATTPEATTPTPMTVTTVDLGNAVDADNRVNVPMSTFATGDTIHASVGSAGDTAGALTAIWTFEDNQRVDSTDKSVAAGPQVTDFSISNAEGWPAGKYRVDILLDGVPAQMREFEVR